MKGHEMPRPRPKQAEPVFQVNVHSLREREKARLLTLLGDRENDPHDSEFDPWANTMRHQHPGYRVHKAGGGGPVFMMRDPNASTAPPEKDGYLAILDVEQTLGLYAPGAEHLDKSPRPADYRQTFRAVQRAAKNLLQTLTDWSGYYRDQLKLKGADIQAIETALTSLADVSAAVVKDFKGKSSKGAPRNTALTEVIQRLRRIFRDNYRGPRGNRTRRGAFQFLANWERNELEFVRTALRSARIIREGDRRLARLFRDPRCAVSEESTSSARKPHHAKEREQKKNPA